jgi:hypothetical protein
MTAGTAKNPIKWRRLAILCCTALIGAFLVFSFVFTRTLKVEGVAPDLAALDKRMVPAYFPEALPPDAKDVQYYAVLYHGFCQAVFPYNELHFLQWCKEQGWPVQAADARLPHTFWVDDRNGTTPKNITRGWYYCGPKHSGTHFWVEVAYERGEGKVYFRIWYERNR